MTSKIQQLILAIAAILGLAALIPATAEAQEAQGKEIFRFDTFGDEQLWTDKLGLHKVVEAKVDPTTALEVGLKVDADALPPGTLEKADLENPATTVALLKLNAVVGLKAEVDANNHIKRLGVTCALCHSTVDDSVQKGIGKRLDGWPNRDLDVGKIISLSPALTAEQRKVYTSWGPGKYDPRYNQDGKSSPLVLPPAYGLAQVKNETYTAEGPISYWNAYVAVTQMGGQGNFSDPRLKIDVKHSPDLVTSTRAARLSTQPAGADRRRVELRRDRCAARPRHVQSHLRNLPRGRQRHGQQFRQAAPARRDRHGCRLRHAYGKQVVPHDALAWLAAPPAVLPRWQRQDPC
jgi:hypothetical protein